MWRSTRDEKIHHDHPGRDHLCPGRVAIRRAALLEESTSTGTHYPAGRDGPGAGAEFGPVGVELPERIFKLPADCREPYGNDLWRLIPAFVPARGPAPGHPLCRISLRQG